MFCLHTRQFCPFCSPSQTCRSGQKCPKPHVLLVKMAEICWNHLFLKPTQTVLHQKSQVCPFVISLPAIPYFHLPFLICTSDFSIEYHNIQWPSHCNANKHHSIFPIWFVVDIMLQGKPMIGLGPKVLISAKNQHFSFFWILNDRACHCLNGAGVCAGKKKTYFQVQFLTCRQKKICSKKPGNSEI